MTFYVVRVQSHAALVEDRAVKLWSVDFSTARPERDDGAPHDTPQTAIPDTVVKAVMTIVYSDDPKLVRGASVTLQETP